MGRPRNIIRIYCTNWLYIHVRCTTHISDRFFKRLAWYGSTVRYQWSPQKWVMSVMLCYYTTPPVYIESCGQYLFEVHMAIFWVLAPSPDHVTRCFLIRDDAMQVKRVYDCNAGLKNWIYGWSGAKKLVGSLGEIDWSIGHWKLLGEKWENDGNSTGNIREGKGVTMWRMWASCTNFLKPISWIGAGGSHLGQLDTVIVA